MPQLKRPDYQPPQTLAGHIAPRGIREDGHHVTATSPPHNGETGGAGAPLRAPSYRCRTVKGHWEKGLGLGHRWDDYWPLGKYWALVTTSHKRCNIVSYNTGTFTLELWNSSDEGKYGLLWRRRVCGVSMMGFFLLSREGRDSMT